VGRRIAIVAACLVSLPLQAFWQGRYLGDRRGHGPSYTSRRFWRSRSWRGRKTSSFRPSISSRTNRVQERSDPRRLLRRLSGSDPAGLPSIREFAESFIATFMKPELGTLERAQGGSALRTARLVQRPLLSDPSLPAPPVDHLPEPAGNAPWFPADESEVGGLAHPVVRAVARAITELTERGYGAWPYAKEEAWAWLGYALHVIVDSFSRAHTRRETGLDGAPFRKIADLCAYHERHRNAGPRGPQSGDEVCHHSLVDRNDRALLVKLGKWDLRAAERIGEIYVRSRMKPEAVESARVAAGTWFCWRSSSRRAKTGERPSGRFRTGSAVRPSGPARATSAAPRAEEPAAR